MKHSKPNPETIKIVSDEEAEAASHVVCARALPGQPRPLQPYELHPCTMCGHEMLFSPHSPKTPLKICVECAMVLATAAEEPPRHVVTQRTMQSVLEEIHLINPDLKKH